MSHPSQESENPSKVDDNGLKMGEKKKKIYTNITHGRNLTWTERATERKKGKKEEEERKESVVSHAIILRP